MADDRARQRAKIIMQVCSGAMTAVEGARQLGVSRKTYYEWENRALTAMSEAMEDREAGRPETAQEDPEKEALKRALAETQKELCVARESLYVRRVLDDYAAKRVEDAERGAKKKPR
jgi:transposase-like protein